KVRDLDYTKTRSKIDELCVSNIFFNGDIVELMKEIVPEFVSNNSEFCKLDEKETAKQVLEKKENKVYQN
ncbi:MAG: polysaccharide biosynthesis protein, partial [Flavobacteriaceae bacterium]